MTMEQLWAELQWVSSMTMEQLWAELQWLEELQLLEDDEDCIADTLD